MSTQTAPPPDAPPAPRSVRPWRWVFGGVAALVAGSFFAAWLLEGRYPGGDLAALVARLDAEDPGWRLEDVVKARGELPDDENSALVVNEVRRRLGLRWNSDEFYRMLNDLAAGRDLTAAERARLRRELDDQAAAVALARRIADVPRGRHRLELAENVWLTLLEDQQGSRVAALLLRMDAVRRADAGDAAGAMRSVRAAYRTAASLDTEIWNISHLIRCACLQLATDALEHALSRTEPAEADLAALVPVLEAEDADNGVLRAYRGERAAMHKTYADIAAGKYTIGDLGEPLDAVTRWRATWLGWDVRRRVRQEHPIVLDLNDRWVRLAKLPPHERIPHEDALEAELKELVARTLTVRLTMPNLRKIGDADRRGKANVRCALAMIAAERYRRDNGVRPDAAGDLVPQYLREVPTDPFDGKPLRMKAVPEGVVFWSVGMNRTDEGGDIARGKPGHPEDHGVRLLLPVFRVRPAEELGEPNEAK